VNSAFTDDAARLNAVLSGSAGIAPGVPPALAKANAGSSRLVLGNAPGSGFSPLTMRVNTAPFTDVRVRRAFKLLTNREAFVNDVYDGYATIGNDCAGAHRPYWASDIKPTYDPERAKSLLKAAGQADMSLNVYTAPVVPGFVESATLWAAQAAAVGLRVQVKQLPASTYLTPSSRPGYLSNQRQFSLNWWLSLSSLAEFYVQTLTATAPYNETGWALADRSQERLVLDALGELNPTKAADKWHAVQEQQVAEGGYIIPTNNNNVDAYAANVRGGNTTPYGNNSFYDYHRISLA
jgi:peptide/nickel transport system substrate-binding protein